MHRKLKTSRGFSLIEMLVAMAIAGVLLAVGIPSFKDFMAHSEMTKANNALVYSLQLARSASMERLEPVGLCISDDPMADAANCQNGTNYNQGWLVYADSNRNGALDVAEDILHRVEPFGPAFQFTPEAVFATQIYFNDAGASVNVAEIPISGMVGINYGDGTQLREITVSANGRVTTATPP